MNGFDPELQKAMRLSEESFAKEQSLREQALQIERDIETKKKNAASHSNTRALRTLIDLTQWNPMFVNRGVGCGLQNLGNSCFMNATLQCLAYTPALAQLLCQSNHSKTCESQSFCALCSMSRVIPALLINKQTVRPLHLFRHLPAINDLLTPGCQEDAHEFIQSLLDKLEIAFDTHNPNPSIKNQKPLNPIRKLFTGATKTTIECVRCRRQSVTEEPFCCLSLEIDASNVDLCEALEIFTRDELLRGADKYRCEHCAKKCVAHKRMTLSQCPPILVLHLKRFAVTLEASHHKQSTTTRKLSAHVAFPETLDLSTLQHLLFDSDRERELIDGAYELYAVLVHSGPRLGYGHYYALVKAADGRWYRCNDAQVGAVNVAHVLREQGYVVFYRRRTTHLMRCELKRMEREEQKESGSGSDLDAATMLRMVETSERMAKEKEGLKEKVAEEKCTVDTALLTDDYFAKKCGAEREKDIDGVLVDVENEEANAMADRASYVKVPPMAQRPVVNEHGHANGSPEAVELFWPPAQME